MPIGGPWLYRFPKRKSPARHLARCLSDAERIQGEIASNEATSKQRGRLDPRHKLLEVTPRRSTALSRFSQHSPFTRSTRFEDD